MILITEIQLGANLQNIFQVTDDNTVVPVIAVELSALGSALSRLNTELGASNILVRGAEPTVQKVIQDAKRYNLSQYGNEDIKIERWRND